MISSILNKIIESCIVLFVISVAVFLLIGLMPGDPIDIMLAANPNATAEDAARLRALYGLDKPLWQQYLDWGGQFVQGDLGHSRLFNQPVSTLLASAAWNTFSILSISIVLSLLLALPCGIYSALHKNSFIAKSINFICYMGISIPPFWLALMLVTIFSISLRWLPAGGMPDARSDAFAPISFYILPVMALTLASIGGYIRYIRAGVLEAMDHDHIRTAYAKGLSKTRVVLVHALPQAMIPVVTIIALDFGTLFSGAVITETIFNWRGMGRLVYDAIMGNDYHLALSALLIITAMIITANMIADLLYRVLDPRIRTQNVQSRSQSAEATS